MPCYPLVCCFPVLDKTRSVSLHREQLRTPCPVTQHVPIEAVIDCPKLIHPRNSRTPRCSDETARMSDGQARNGTKGQPVKGQASMDDIWDEAAEEFKKICKKALHFKEGDPKYKLRTFDDVQKRIEDAGKGVYEPEEIQKGTGKKTREVALRSLSLLKMLVGAAAEVASGIVRSCHPNHGLSLRHRPRVAVSS